MLPRALCTHTTCCSTVSAAVMPNTAQGFGQIQSAQICCSNDTRKIKKKKKTFYRNIKNFLYISHSWCIHTESQRAKQLCSFIPNELLNFFFFFLQNLFFMKQMFSREHKIKGYCSLFFLVHAVGSWSQVQYLLCLRSSFFKALVLYSCTGCRNKHELRSLFFFHVYVHKTLK